MTSPDKIQPQPISEIFSNVTVKQSISSYGTPKNDDSSYPQASFSLSNSPHKIKGKSTFLRKASQHSNRAVRVKNMALVIKAGSDKKKKEMNQTS